MIQAIMRQLSLPRPLPVTFLPGLEFALLRLSGGFAPWLAADCGLAGFAACFVFDFDLAAADVVDFDFAADFAPDLVVDLAAILPRAPRLANCLPFDLAPATARDGSLTSTIRARTAESVSFSTVGETGGNTAVS